MRPTGLAGVRFRDLFGRAVAAEAGDPIVTGVTLDSRRVRPGDLYVGLPGRLTHGARFAGTALAAGAVAVLTDADGAAQLAPGVAVAVVGDPRLAMAQAAATVYGRPAERLTMFAITGTNGKTSTTFMVEAGLAASGRVAGALGTLGFRLDGHALAASRTTVTTPESSDLQAILAVMEQGGASCVVMEVSSHALAMDRVAGVRFDVAAFTMLGHDHLDFHPSIDDYFEAKAALFAPERTRVAVVNIDDRWGAKLADRITSQGEVRLVSTSNSRPADYRIRGWRPRPDGGSDIDLETPRGALRFGVAMPGEFNVRNAVTALAMLVAGGVEPADAVRGLESASVPGRMQRVDLPGGPNVVVDFAHTPEAVAAALAALPGRTVAVLGCGGDRDAAKRGPMGAVAVRGADVVVVTDDNPRSEDPQAIRAAVLAGAKAAATRGQTVLDGGDRRSAITTALGLARRGDWVAILGKGHEQGQQIGDTTLPFDDVRVVGEQWAGMAGPEGGQ